ncbi:uncharacterized protein LOC119106969 [Pollicipes pollicipes]|uniref:uncharacterized protein LOC119106969 n=1 Tax=Pollicipes pollicipes TaxID=41117 RepID=UPI00188529BF|nr:uncharacterized protein LOC119106969 [Pollicipes pollicipes]
MAEQSGQRRGASGDADLRPARTLRVQFDGAVHELLLTGDADTDDVEDLLRTLAGCGPGDILKLVTSEGQLVTPKFLTGSSARSEGTLYRLTKAASHVCGRNILSKEEDLRLLKERLDSLETKLLESARPVPPSVKDLQTNVWQLLRQLHRIDLIDWLGKWTN